jgi:hypothetical protein
MKEELIKKIGEVVLGLGVKESKVVLDYPTYSELGDFTTNIAMVHAKELGKKPIDLANEIKDKIENSGLGSISKINVINPGFINFFISPKYFAEALDQKNYGSLFSGQKVFFEHSQTTFLHPQTHLQVDAIIRDNHPKFLFWSEARSKRNVNVLLFVNTNVWWSSIVLVSNKIFFSTTSSQCLIEGIAVIAWEIRTVCFSHGKSDLCHLPNCTCPPLRI